MKIENVECKKVVYGNYIVTIEKCDKYFDFWLCSKNCGIKEFMFGIFIEDLKNDDDIIDFIERNIDSCIESYEKTIETLESIEV